MNRISLSVLSLAFLAGCGYSEEKFSDDYVAATCDNLSSCESTIVEGYVALGMDEATAQASFDTTYTAACDTEASEDTASDVTLDEDCEFDSAKAKECVEAMKTADCGIWTGESTFPAVCSEVCGAAAAE